MPITARSANLLRQCFRVGEWLVDPARLKIADEAREVALEPRVMELLIYLAERAGAVIGVEALLADIWHGAFYGDGPVQRAIAILRRCLGDHVQTPRYIETVRKRGYRLIAPVVLPERELGVPATSGAWWARGSPFVGLRAFDAGHAAVFFGRARATAQLLDALLRQAAGAHRLVLVVGASGCGKTSLLEAGVLPLLTRVGGYQGLQVEAVARLDGSAASSGEALLRLAEALCHWQLGARRIFFDAEQLADRLRIAPLTIADDIAAAFAQFPTYARDASAHLLLLIDHAEALLAADGEPSSALGAFDGALAALSRCTQVLTIVLSRSDFYPRLLAQLPSIATLKMPDGHFDLLPPGSGELAEIIRRPALAAGLTFEVDNDAALGLDDVLRDAAVAHPEALPMLQYTLQSLYEERRQDYLLSFDTYRRLGGLGGALAQRAESLLSSLPRAVQAALPDLLERMVVGTDTASALTARRLSWTLLVSAEQRALARALVDARLFTSSLSAGVATICVAHETLLREWPRVQDWVGQNQRRLQTRQRVHAASLRWRESKQSSDLLLSPGLPLTEALQLRAEAASLLDADDHALILASDARDRRRRRLRRLAMAGALALSVASAISAALALIAHQDALRRRAQVEGLMDYLLTDFADQVRPLGRLILMDNVAHRALDYLSTLSPREVDATAHLQRARALRTLGEVFLERADNAAARTAFGQAEAILDQLPADGASESTKRIAERSTLAFWLGMQDYREGMLDSAQVHFVHYRDLATALIAREPENPEWKLELSYALNNLGTLAGDRQNSTQALALFAQSVALKSQVLQAHPDNTQVAIELADSLSWIGSTLEVQGRLQEADQHYQRQRTVLNAIAQGDRRSDGWRYRQALADLIGADLAVATGRNEQAEPMYARAENTLLDLVAADPSNRTWQRNLGVAQAQRALLWLRRGQATRARQILVGAAINLRALLDDDSPSAEWLRLGALIQLRSAQAAWIGGDRDLAVQKIQDAFARISTIIDNAADDIANRQLAARIRITQGDYLAARGQKAAAIAAWKQARAELGVAAEHSSDRRVLEPWIAASLRLGFDREATMARNRLIAGGYRDGSATLL